MATLDVMTDDFTEETARAVVETLYDDLSSLSRGVENSVQLVQRFTGMLRDELPDNEDAQVLADALAGLGQALGLELGRVAAMQDRIREHGLAPPHEASASGLGGALATDRQLLDDEVDDSGPSAA
jgi:hypothetical protein